MGLFKFFWEGRHGRLDNLVCHRDIPAVGHHRVAVSIRDFALPWLTLFHFLRRTSRQTRRTLIQLDLSAMNHTQRCPTSRNVPTQSKKVLYQSCALCG